MTSKKSNASRKKTAPKKSRATAKKKTASRRAASSSKKKTVPAKKKTASKSKPASARKSSATKASAKKTAQAKDTASSNDIATIISKSSDILVEIKKLQHQLEEQFIQICVSLKKHLGINVTEASLDEQVSLFENLSGDGAKSSRLAENSESWEPKNDWDRDVKDAAQAPEPGENVPDPFDFSPSADEPQEPERASFDEDDAKKALQDVVSEKGLPLAKKVLEEFGASKLTDLHEKSYPRFVKKCQQACA